VPPPAPQATYWELPLTESTQARGELPAGPEQIVYWCEAARFGRSISINAMAEHFADPDGRNGRPNYEAFLDKMVHSRLLSRVGGSVGHKLTPRGWRFVEAALKVGPDAATPLLEAQKGQNALPVPHTHNDTEDSST
jgi:hypothetical protein